MFAYEEQYGCVKLAGKKSDEFTVTNGTKQGSVLLPLLFSVYLDDLLQELRKLQLGCHIGGVWMGACGYADDLALLAPSRDVLQCMLNICESYALEHNLVFSTDPVAARLKTKYGREGRRVRYPANVQLHGKDLPWVETVQHIGHNLHQTCGMNMDCRQARAKFISKTVEFREQLSFANPKQILKAIQLYCSYAYGGMLWNLS